MVKKFDDVYIHLDAIPHHDGQSDRNAVAVSCCAC